ncbi:hypothetical protein ACWAUC_15030 [Bradyrhizobium guangdongense]
MALMDLNRTERKWTAKALREEANHCAQRASASIGGPDHRRYKRMEEAWLALAEEQAVLDGETPLVEPARSVTEIQVRAELKRHRKRAGILD